tara:strand:+ start:3301 stop:3765 length:465 start_codon:yes stop_codon:yes gene_type:complete
MSKGMRVCDREIIERQVRNAWETKSKEDFEKEFTDSGVCEVVLNKFSEINNMIDNIQTIEANKNALEDEIKELVENFNECHSLGKSDSYYNSYNGTYISLNNMGYNSKHQSYEIKTSVPNDIRISISDELGLQTMSGDFNAKAIVESLIKRFVG